MGRPVVLVVFCRELHGGRRSPADPASLPCVPRTSDDDRRTKPTRTLQRSMVLALPCGVRVAEPSYSLKVVEKSEAVVALTGFSRSADDVTKGDDSIAAFIEAVETEDMTRRDAIVAAICAYNQEDLEATWAVLR